MHYDLPREVWHIIRTAILVCANKAPISELRKALRGAGCWPPSKALKEIDTKCKMDSEVANKTIE